MLFCARKTRIVFMDTKETVESHPEPLTYSVETTNRPLSVEEPIAWYLQHAASATDKTGVKRVRNEARAAYMRRFGERCKLARGAREIADVAATVGVHRNTIWNIERGDSLPDAFELEILAREYQTTPALLLEGQPDTPLQGLESTPKSLQVVVSMGWIHVPLF